MKLFKNHKMKKIILFTFAVIFSLGAFAITPGSKSSSENPGIPYKKENKMSAEEANRLTKRTEELKNIDNSQQVVVVSESHGSRRGHEGMNRENRRSGGVIYLGGGGLLLLIIILIIVL